jgi:hypothetical protein
MRARSTLPPSPVELPEEREVLHRGQVGVQREVPGDVPDGSLRLERATREAVDGDLALVGDHEPAHHGDGGGLAGAVRAQEAVALSLSYEEGHAVDGLAAAVALAQAFTLQHR